MKHVKIFENWLSERYADDHPKNKYIEMSSKDAAKYADEIIKMIVGAYASKGGHHEFKNASDIKNGEITYWITNDVDVDPEADVVLGGKFTDSGIKMTVVGQDGSPEGKKSMMDKVKELMKTRGFYAEMDPDLAQKMGLPAIRNEKAVRDVVHKELTWNNDGSYNREVGGKMKTKVLVGMPS